MQLRPLLRIRVMAPVIGLLAVSLAVLAPMYSQPRCSKVTSSKMIIKNVEQALVHFQTDTDQLCPRTMDELFTRGYLARAPVDSWGHALRMHCPGSRDPNGVDIVSAGRDGRFDTADDLRSWEL